VGSSITMQDARYKIRNARCIFGHQS
jgi:hypothetical protein